MKQLVEAIEYLQLKGIMHRDLKPANILIDAHNNVKLCDFGLATTLNDIEERRLFCGSPGYFAPEVLRAKSKANRELYGVEIDTWALGICMFYFLEGRLPF
jgi:serine/threonine protein kinase